MFVPMVAVPLPVLSDQPPDFPRKAGLGDRFHYFRGRSSRRYLFSVVPHAELADFCSAVVILAKRTSDGRLAAYAMTTLDRSGRPDDNRRPWPPIIPADAVVLIHLLAASESDRHDLVDDLTPPALLALAA
jgi:hypothetical protein